MNWIDARLNTITMYRLVLYSLLLISGVAIILGYFQILPYSAAEFLASLTVISTVGFICNEAFARLFRATKNFESGAITSLILFLITAPSLEPKWLIGSALVTVVAIGSKYLFAVRRAHLFNPAAIAAVLVGSANLAWINWWVGSTVLAPVVAVLGFLIVRKIRRGMLFATFIASSVVSIVVFTGGTAENLSLFLIEIFTAWPILFFSTIMLTEPITTPPTKRGQMLYGTLVGILFGARYHVGPIYSTPELALVLGNLASFMLYPRQHLVLTLRSKLQLTDSVYHFTFHKPVGFTFQPGQYLEWTVPTLLPDSRGNRRYFTIASSPTENTLSIGVKTAKNGSSFKRTLMAMKKGETIVAHDLSGDFTLPTNRTEKLVFIAGGVGITPFRSMVQSMIDQAEHRDTVLLYACANGNEFAYSELFEMAAQQKWFTYIPIISKAHNAPKNWAGETGYITEPMLQRHVPDWSQRRFYLSGPSSMVDSYTAMLTQMGVARNQIVTDYFPGF